MSYSKTITREDLTNILNEVLPSEENLYSASATPSGAYWSSGSITVYRRGKMGMLKLNGANISALSTRTMIATVPSAFSAMVETSGKIDGTSTDFFITGNEIRLNASSAGQKWGNIIYFIA